MKRWRNWRLEGVIVCARAVSHQVEFAAEVGVRRVVEVLPHQLAGSGADVGQGDTSVFPRLLSTDAFHS